MKKKGGEDQDTKTSLIDDVYIQVCHVKKKFNMPYAFHCLIVYRSSDIILYIYLYYIYIIIISFWVLLVIVPGNPVRRSFGTMTRSQSRSPVTSNSSSTGTAAPSSSTRPTRRTRASTKWWPETPLGRPQPQPFSLYKVRKKWNTWKLIFLSFIPEFDCCKCLCK